MLNLTLEQPNSVEVITSQDFKAAWPYYDWAWRYYGMGGNVPIDPQWAAFGLDVPGGWH